jgi:endonuclease G
MKKLVFALLALSATNAHAHSGRTNADGCHNSAVYGYHCHNSTPTPTPTPTPAPVVEKPVYVPPVYVPPVISKPIVEKPVYTPPVYVPPVISKPVIEIPETLQTGVIKTEYEGFTLWVDCAQRAATKFQYNAQFDMGNFSRDEWRFAEDDLTPKECQQTSNLSYGKNYDRGHLVPANHLDYSRESVKESFWMSNILPQASNMNRGAWLATEEIIECYRDVDDLVVIGGVIFGNNTKDDYFVESHGIKTPDSFWKVVIRSGGDAIAWNIPNVQTAIRSKLDSYLVTVAQIEKLTGEKIPVSAKMKTQKLTKSWVLPKGCDKG